MRAWSGRDLSGKWPHPLVEELVKYMDEARSGSNYAAQIVRILTPLVKFRACRDAILAARAAEILRRDLGLRDSGPVPR